MEKFSSEDFESLTFNPYELHHRTDLLNAFPILAQYDEFQVDLKLSKNKVIRYILYLYDKNSVLRMKIDDLMKRKLAALELSGFIKERSDKFSKDVEEMVLCRNFDINNMIFRFLRVLRKPKFSFLCAMEETFYQHLKRMLNGEALTTNAIQAIKVLENDIETRAIELLNEDNTEKLIQDLYTFVEFSELNIMPEDYAKMVKEKR